MLVLSRIADSLPGRPKSEIVIETSDGPVVVKVLEVRDGHKVRLGISAPPKVDIRRAELLDGQAKEPAA